MTCRLHVYEGGDLQATLAVAGCPATFAATGGSTLVSLVGLHKSSQSGGKKLVTVQQSYVVNLKL